MNDSHPANTSTEELFGRSPLLMSRHNSALVVVDMQEKLVPHIQNSDRVLWNVERIVDGAKILELDIRFTEQYPRGLGSTVDSLRERVGTASEKVTFSCLGCDGLFQELASNEISNVLLVGIETHVCVQQTALDLLAAGFEVFLACDAVSSRFDLDHETALRRMESIGVTLTTVESALFEWCETSKAPEFKSISKIVQQTRE